MPLGRFVGTIIKNPNIPLLAASDLYVDFVGGNDVNNGAEVTPVKSLGRLAMILGSITTIYPDITTRNGSTHRFIDVHLVNVPPLDNGTPSDPLSMMLATLGWDVVLRFFGTPTVLQTGTFTSVTAITHATNTPNSVTDTALASFAPFLSQRIQIVGGPRDGAYAWIAKDLGGHACRTSNFAIDSSDDVLGGPTPVVPQVGDAYEILQLQEIRMGTFIGSAGGDTDVSPGSTVQPTIVFHDLAFGDLAGATTGTATYPSMLTSVMLVRFWGCQFNTEVGVSYSTSAEFMNCWITGGSQEFAFGSFGFDALLSFFSGGCTGSSRIAASGSVVFDQDYLCQGCTLLAYPGSSLQTGSVGIFDATAGVRVMPSANLMSAPGADAEALYGSGNSGVGVQIDAGGVGTYTSAVPTLTGAGGDFSLGLATSAFGFNSSTGVFVGPTTCTWTHFAASLAAGTGFGGNAQNPKFGAYFVLQAAP